MTPDELQHCLARLEAHYPGDWTPERQAVWAESFVKRDFAEVAEAINDMAANTEFATTTQFIAAYQGVLRRSRVAETAPALPPGSGVASGPMFDGLRAVFGLTRPKHDHRNGAEGCPLCNLHDLQAHKRDRHGFGPPQCPRCKELAELFYEGAKL